MRRNSSPEGAAVASEKGTAQIPLLDRSQAMPALNLSTVAMDRPAGGVNLSFPYGSTITSNF